MYITQNQFKESKNTFHQKKTEIENIIENEAIHQIQYYKNLYLTHKKSKCKNNNIYFSNSYIFDSNSRSILIKYVLNLLIETFCKLHPSQNMFQLLHYLHIFSKISLLVLLSSL